MHRSARMVSATANGDYYQLMFDDGGIAEEKTKPGELPKPYVLLQRQFEWADDDKCYLESDDEEYIGHFRLILIELTPNRLIFEIERVKNNRVEVEFALTSSQFAEVLAIVRIIFGLVEPGYGDDV